MKAVYEAAHGIEAHMIVDLLRQEGIRGLVQGEYLQGAIGALPAAGLVHVVVDEDDYELARRVIDRWCAQQVAEDDAPAPAEPQPRGAAISWPWFAAGLLVGAMAAFASGLVGTAQADTEQLCRP